MHEYAIAQSACRRMRHLSVLIAPSASNPELLAGESFGYVKGAAYRRAERQTGRVRGG